MAVSRSVEGTCIGEWDTVSAQEALLTAHGGTGTVEDKILELQTRKRAMAETALGDGDGGLRAAAGRLTMQDLHFLFSGMR